MNMAPPGYAYNSFGQLMPAPQAPMPMPSAPMPQSAPTSTSTTVILQQQQQAPESTLPPAPVPGLVNNIIDIGRVMLVSRRADSPARSNSANVAPSLLPRDDRERRIIAIMQGAWRRSVEQSGFTDSRHYEWPQELHNQLLQTYRSQPPVRNEQDFDNMASALLENVLRHYVRIVERREQERVLRDAVSAGEDIDSPRASDDDDDASDASDLSDSEIESDSDSEVLATIERLERLARDPIRKDPLLELRRGSGRISLEQYVSMREDALISQVAGDNSQRKLSSLPGWNQQLERRFYEALRVLYTRQ